jgi:hypothetical protein
MDWRTPALSDLETLQKCALNNNFFANNYGAVNSILYEKKFHSLIAFDGEWIFEKFFEGEKTCFSFPHNLLGKSDGAKEALEILAGDARSKNERLIFENITAEEKDILQEFWPSVKITPTPESGDYIYRTENLSSLAGKKLSRKRNHIQQFDSKYPDFSFELLRPENLSFVREVEEKWLEENSDFAKTNGTLSDLEIEREIIFYALDTLESFSQSCGMSGGILFASGNPVAFCIASILSERVTDVHFEKSLYSFGRDGAYAKINNEFSKTVRTEFLNREEDLGIEGLRKAKLSYYPEKVLEKFLVETED